MQAVPVDDWDGDGGPILGTPYWVSLEDITTAVRLGSDGQGAWR